MRIKVYGIIAIFLFHTNFVFPAAFGNGHLVKNLVQEYEERRAAAGNGSRIIPCIATTERNKAINKILNKTTNLPEVLNNLIIDYLPSTWFLKNRFNIFSSGSMVCRIALTNFPSKHDFCSYNEDKTECKIWNVSTGHIIKDKARAENIVESNMQDLIPTTNREDVLSFTRCRKNRVMTDTSTQLKLWSGMNLLNAEMNKSIRHFELKNNTVYGLPNVFLSSTFSLCCNYVAAGTLDGKVIIFNRETLEILHTLSHNASVTALQIFSFPEGDNKEQLLLAGLANGSVCVWQGVFNETEEIPSDTTPVHYYPAPSQPPMSEPMGDMKAPVLTPNKQSRMYCCCSCILGCFSLCRNR